jgi:hypothetical protein
MLKSLRFLLIIKGWVALLDTSASPVLSAESGTGVHLLGYQSSLGVVWSTIPLDTD